jgi:hypothetical protein
MSIFTAYAMFYEENNTMTILEFSDSIEISLNNTEGKFGGWTGYNCFCYFIIDSIDESLPEKFSFEGEKIFDYADHKLSIDSLRINLGSSSPSNLGNRIFRIKITATNRLSSEFNATIFGL